MNKKLTVVVVNFNSAEFIGNILYCLKRLTKHNYKVLIIDNDSRVSDYRKLQKIVQSYPDTICKRSTTSLRGSMAHGTALNELIAEVNTPYVSILDADAAWLKKDWDDILIRELNEKVKAIGTVPPMGKPQDFPLMFAILLETEPLKKLGVDFRPSDPATFQDTGHQLREKYLAAGFQGKTIELQSTRTYKKGPFAEIIADEYYLNQDYSHVFATHFGRGSSLGANKYLHTSKRYLYAVPLLGTFLLKKKGKKERETWIRICKDLADSQVSAETTKHDPLFEKLDHCLYCNSSNLEFLLQAPDRLTSNPGMFYLSRCNDCHFIFQNPRVKSQYLDRFYTDELGYYYAGEKSTSPKSMRKKITSFFSTQVLINHFGYVSFGKKNALMKLLTYPLRNIKKRELLPQFVPNGKLLEIGCSNGGYLEELRDFYHWDVQGIEMDAAMVKYAREKRGLNVEQKKIEDAAFNSEQFDVIILGMVIEHLPDPFAALKQITSWLKPGGQLLFSIPYAEGFEFRMFRQYAYPLQLPAHINFLTKKIISEYLVTLGYKNIHLHFQASDRDIVASSQFAYAEYQHPLVGILAFHKAVRRYVIRPFVFLLSLIGKTSRVTVAAQKELAKQKRA